jgi:hypothetical protein
LPIAFQIGIATYKTAYTGYQFAAAFTVKIYFQVLLLRRQRLALLPAFSGIQNRDRLNKQPR